MIKAIITDVDGVIVGDKHGINFPLPNEKVIHKLKELNKRGLPIILCTGKPINSIEGIIRSAQLDNPHITDAGAFISNPLRDQVIKEHSIPSELVTQIVKACLENNMYVEVLAAKNYFIQKDQIQQLTEKRSVILQQEPIVVDSLLDVVSDKKIIKILPFVNNEEDKFLIDDFLTPFAEEIHAFWSTVPFMLPAWAKVVTIKGVSKYHGAQEVLDYLKLSFDDCLGVGDLSPDWLFIKHCQFGACVGDAEKEFKENIISKGEGNYFLAPSVDEDGFLAILDYFKL